MTVPYILIFSVLFIIQCVLVSVAICTAKRYKLFYAINSFCSLACFFMRGIFLMQTDEKKAFIFGAFFLVSEIIFFFSILFFCMICSDYSKLLTKFLKLFLIIVSADSLLILSNILYTDVFTLKLSASGIWGNSIFLIIPKKLFYVHFVLSLIFALLSFVCVFIKWKSVPPVQRKRYNSLLVFSVFFVSLFAFEFFTKKYGYSSAILAFFSSLFCCMSIILVPKKLKAIIISSIQENSNEAIICFDVCDHLVFANARAKEIFNSKKIPLNISSRYLFDFFRKNYDPNYDILRWPSIIEINSKIYHYEVIYQKLYKDNMEIGSFFRLKDVSVAHDELEEQRFYATHDHLTGVLNRQGFFENVYLVLKNNPNLRFGMACSNIKNFKLVNNIFGKEAGNKALIKTAEMIKKHTHKTSVFARIGEDKFAVFAEREFLQEDRILKLIENTSFIEENPAYRVVFNIGIYELNENDERPELALDKALLALKNSIDNRKLFSFFDEKLMDNLVKEKYFIKYFEDYFTDESFFLKFKPVFNSEKKVSGTKLSFKWKELSEDYSTAFMIKTLDKTGLVYKLDSSVWRKSFEVFNQLKSDSKDFFMNVHVCEKDFYYMNIDSYLKRLADEYKVDPSFINVSVPEKIISKNYEKISYVCSCLHDAGFKILIEDFGSDLSSLNMLKNFDVDFIEVDVRFFYKNKDTEDRTRKILSSIASMASVLGIKTIFSGIDSETVCNIAECIPEKAFFEGEYFSFPLSFDELTEKLKV